MRALRVFLLLLVSSIASAAAEVVSIEITRRADVAGGRSFGAAGAYEMIEGRILFAFDPANRYNARIVDLDKAPRRNGRVEAWADFTALRPKQPVANGVALFEVSNRGLKYLLQVLDYGTMAPRPTTIEDVGDALLLRQGLTLVWVGWQHDVPPDDADRLGLEVPVVRNADGSPITGVLRADWVVARTVNSLSVAHGNHVAYPAIDPDSDQHVLTVRDGRYAPRQTVPRSEWRFAREVNGAPVADPAWIYRAKGFEAGRIYELVYRSQDPRVAGLGLAAIRDAMSHAKYDPSSPFAARHAVAFGISQTGRLLRHFLYQGFNTDERGRKVFDGMLIHVAGGGRGSFNHRFAQPSRDGHRYDAFFFPTDLFPFTSEPSTDPETGVTDGINSHLFDRAHLPYVFQTNSGYEYWGRAASLIHTTPDGARDLAPPANERIYLLTSAQHVPGPFPPPDATRHPGSRVYRSQALDYRLPLRALLVGLVEWVRDGKEPLPSAYPTLARGDLVSIDKVAIPSVPDLGRPTVVHQPDRLDYGPRWREGIVDREPPTLSKPFPVLVPQVDSLGNEVGGMRSVELEAPLASYLSWNLRRGQPGDTTELTRILGSYLALPVDGRARAAARDPRPAIASLYPNRDAYLAQARRVANSLVARRMLLEDDIDRAVKRAADHWDWVHATRH
ncbi:MAG: hypothetical protein KF785_14715 [Gemmatimonadales bacterium]|nr:hypothetical protein [Gemmatimonadales bacterium]